MDFNSLPIGIFDSGLGGLTAVKELKKVLPNENIIYFGDTGRVPYGTRSKEIIKRYATSDMKFLLSKNVKMIIAACGTASSVIDEKMIENLGVLYTGVVAPSAIAAVSASKTKVIGVIGTSATINSGKYDSAIKSIDSGCMIIKKACPLFVPLVENGYVSFYNEITRLVAKEYLQEFIDTGSCDTLILGCTHYPILTPIIGDILGERVTLIESGKEAALMAKKLIENNNIATNNTCKGHTEYYVSDSVDSFSQNALPILGEMVEEKVYKINIDEF